MKNFPVEEHQDYERNQSSRKDPGPGVVENNVFLVHPQLGRLHIVSPDSCVSTGSTLGQVDTDFGCFCLKESGAVDQDSHAEAGQDVQQGSAAVRLYFSVMMRSAHSYVSLYSHTYYQVNGATQRDPVNWIVDIGEDVEKLYGVKFPKTVPYSIHDSEHNMQAVTHINSYEDVVEAVSHLSSGQYNYVERVASQSKNTNSYHKHAHQYGELFILFVAFGSFKQS